MFFCLICNANIYWRPSGFIGDKFGRFLHLLNTSDNFWVGGYGEDKVSAANFAVEALYEEAGGRENVDDFLIEPAGFMVKVNSTTGSVEDYDVIGVKVDKRRHNPLRLHWFVEEGDRIHKTELVR